MDAQSPKWLDIEKCPKLRFFTVEGWTHQPGWKVYATQNVQSCQPRDGHAESHQAAFGQRPEYWHRLVGVSGEQTNRVLRTTAKPEVCWQDK